MDSKGTLSSPYPPSIIVMPRFSQHKRDDDSWYSQPFYSALGDYKLCFCVTANGKGSGGGTRVSMYVCLMKGDKDDQLQWPFKHDVTYRILNWKRDENHVINTSDFKNAPTPSKERVTSKERADHAWGCSKFLPHSSLFDGTDIKTQCWKLSHTIPNIRLFGKINGYWVLCVYEYNQFFLYLL